jgi:Asp/Glu/hydantoin racemase
MPATQHVYRIWAQGATDQVGHRHYLSALLPHVRASTDPGFEVEFHTMTPSVTTVHALSEFRFSREVIRSAIRAQEQGYDAFYMNHFQDVGLYEARASVNIPVLGLGETSLLHACTLGRKLGLIAINPAFVPLHADQVARYGLGARVAGIRTIDASIGQWMDAFADAGRKADLWERFQREARVLMAAGADVIVPTGGIPMMLFGAEPGAHVDGAPVVNGVTILIKAAEMAIKLRAIAGLGPSRVAHSGFALPSAQALAEFMEHG